MQIRNKRTPILGSNPKSRRVVRMPENNAAWGHCQSVTSHFQAFFMGFIVLITDIALPESFIPRAGV